MEAAADAQRALHANGSTHGLHHAFGERETQTRSPDGIPVGAQALEGREDLLESLFVDAGAGVRDLDAQPIALGLLAPENNHAVTAIELDGVGEKIQQHLRSEE